MFFHSLIVNLSQLSHSGKWNTCSTWPQPQLCCSNWWTNWKGKLPAHETCVTMRHYCFSLTESTTKLPVSCVSLNNTLPFSMDEAPSEFCEVLIQVLSATDCSRYQLEHSRNLFPWDTSLLDEHSPKLWALSTSGKVSVAFVSPWIQLSSNFHAYVRALAGHFCFT